MKCVKLIMTRTDNGQVTVVPTWEHKIAGSRGTDFAKYGDSGSWVYTLGGEPAGMLKGGDEAHGTGTMSLMPDIFDDIKSVTGAINVRVARAPDS